MSLRIEVGGDWSRLRIAEIWFAATKQPARCLKFREQLL